MSVTLRTPLDVPVEWEPDFRPFNTPLTGPMTLFMVKGDAAWVMHGDRAHMVSRKAIRRVR